MDHRWVIVYAGLPMDVPLSRRRQLIADVLEAATSFATPEHTIVIGQEADSPLWSALAARFPVENLLIEPFSRGTGTGVLAALLLIAGRSQSAVVTVVYGAPLSGQSEFAKVAQDGLLLGEDEVFAPFTHDSVAIAQLPTWLHRAESADRARLEALRNALTAESSPAHALDSIYPFLTVWDFRRNLLEYDNTAQCAVPAEPSMMPNTGQRAQAVHRSKQRPP